VSRKFKRVDEMNDSSRVGDKVDVDESGYNSGNEMQWEKLI
jgi:hypothetical protein